jgi:hypothetical protein
MKSWFVLAAILFATPAFAEDEPASSSELVLPGGEQTPTAELQAAEPAPPAADAPGGDAPGSDAPSPAPVKARMSTQPQQRTQARSTVKDDGEGRLDKTEDTVAGGKHWRIKTRAGAVHVWIPPGYDRATAGTVVYVHGYWTDADGAWREHNLARQFRASRQNALFIVPDAPSSNEDSVKWPALKDLRKAIARANIVMPDGPVIVMGHSGAFRTVMQWVDHRLVEQIILLDAMYAGESAFDEFIGHGKRADQHKLIVVGADTAQGSETFAKKYKFAVAREKMPATYSGFSKREKRAKLLYIRSQFEHMSMVTSGKVIPVLLHLTPLKSL